MFCYCENLDSLPDLSIWNIKNVKNMSKIFCGCKKLESLPDISNWKTKNISTDMFCGCEKLDFLNGISKMDISRVTNKNMIFFQFNTLKRLKDFDYVLGKYIDDYGFRKELKKEIVHVKVKKSCSDILRAIVEGILRIFDNYMESSTRKIRIARWI